MEVNSLLIGLLIVPLYLIGLYALIDLFRERNSYREARDQYIDALKAFNAERQQ